METPNVSDENFIITTKMTLMNFKLFNIVCLVVEEQESNLKKIKINIEKKCKEMQTQIIFKIK